MIDVLKQIASSVGGTLAEHLVSKGDKQLLHDEGCVWPAYGSLFRLTPAGKRRAEGLDITVAPFSCIGEEELRFLCEIAWDSEWDRQQGLKWLEKAL